MAEIMPPSRSSGSEIDRLGVELKNGKYSVDALIRLDAHRSSYLVVYERVIGVLRDALHLAVTGRPAKSTSAIVEKLNRESTRLSQVQDIAGCRVVVEDIPAQDMLLRTLAVFLPEATTYDRRKKSSHGYRAVHMVARFDGRQVEIQIRTRMQHLWAELSEKMADTIDPNIKYGVGDADALGILDRLSVAIAQIEADEVVRAQVMKHVASMNNGVTKKLKKEVKVVEKKFQAQKRRLVQLLGTVREQIGP